MPAVIRVSAVYTMSDQVSSKLAKMATKVTALERSLGNATTKLDNLGTQAKNAVNPLGDVNKQLADMKKTVGTSKGSTGLVYRVDQLNRKLKALAGGRDGHKIKVSTTGIKSSERSILALHAKAAALTSGEYRIKITVDKESSELLREQATALDRVAGSIKDVKLGFTALKQGEAELRSTMRAKTQAAETQRKVLTKVERQMTRNQKSVMAFNRAARDGGLEAKSFTAHMLDMHRANMQAGTAFVRGAKMGFPLARMLPMLAVGANLAGVAIGGLLVSLHGLIAPILSVASSLKDMVGVVGLLPAAYGAAAVAIGSFMGAMNSYFGDALTNAGKLNEIQKKLDTVKDADERKTLLEQQSKLLGEMNPKQKKLAEGAAGLMKQWREMFTSNTALQDKFFGTAFNAIDTASALIKRYTGDIQSTADAVRGLVDEFLTVVRTNEDFNRGMQAVFRIARMLVGTLRTALAPLLTFFGRLMVASERPITRIANAFERWATSLSDMPTAQIEKFLTRGVDSAAQWWRVIKNIGVAFGNIFRAGAGVSSGFEEATRQFREFTESAEGFALIQREFKNGMKVAKALGRFLKELVYQFMVLGADGEVGRSVIEFIDILTKGLPGLFRFMAGALKELGPALNNFIRSLPSILELFEAAVPGMILALDVLAEINKVIGFLIDNIPGLKTLIGLLLAFKAASFIFGGALGHIVGLFSGGAGAIGLFTKKLRGLKGLLKGGGLAGGLTAVGAGMAGGGGAPGAGGAGGGAGWIGGAGAAASGVKTPGARMGYNMLRAGGAGKAGAAFGAARALGSGSMKVVPVVGVGLMAYDAVNVMNNDSLSGVEKAAGVGRIGGVAAAGATGAALGSALGPVGTVGGAVVGTAAGLTVDPLAAKLGGKFYGLDDAQKKLSEQELAYQVVMDMKPVIQGIHQQEQDLVKTQDQYLKDALRGQDLAKKLNKEAAVRHGVEAGLTKSQATRIVNLTAQRQQANRIAALQKQVQDGVIKGEKAIADAAKKRGINDPSKVSTTLEKKRKRNVQLVDGKEYTVVKDKAEADRRRQAAALAGRYGQVTADAKGPAFLTEDMKKRKEQQAATEKAMFGQQASQTANQFKAYTDSVNKQIDTQKAAVQTAIADYRAQGVKLPENFGKGIERGTPLAVKNTETSGKKIGTQIDTTGKMLEGKAQGYSKSLGGIMSQWAVGGSAPGASPTTGATGSPFASPLAAASPTAMAGGGVVPGDPRRPDSVHTLLKPGEVVLNEGQQRKLGMANVKKSLSGPGTAANGAFGFGNMTGAPASALNYAGGGVVPALKPYMDAAVKLGATITSTTGGGHAANSQHYSGHAFDSDGGPAVNMKTFRAFEGDAQAGKVTELFFDPAGGYSGGKSIGAIGGHGDHAHTGIRGGAGGAANIGGGLGPPPKAPKMPNFGSTSMGKATQSRANSLLPAIQARINAAHAASGGGALMGHADPNMPGSPKAIGQQMAASMYGWGGGEWSALSELWRRESQWNPTAKNPSSGAYGIPQALPASKMPFAAQEAGGSSASAQIGWGLNYIKERYGAPSKAVSFHDRMNWYGRGGEGLANSPTTIGVGDKPEHVQITPTRTEANPGGAINSIANQGSARANVTNNFYIGVLAGDEKTMRQLADMVGNTIADQIEGAAGSSVADSVEVMGGNG